MRSVLHRASTLFVAAAALAIAGCGSKSSDPTETETAATMSDPLSKPFAMLAADPPEAEKRPVEIEQHGKTRVDNYAWMRDEEW